MALGFFDLLLILFRTYILASASELPQVITASNVNACHYVVTFQMMIGAEQLYK